VGETFLFSSLLLNIQVYRHSLDKGSYYKNLRSVFFNFPVSVGLYVSINTDHNTITYSN
jgi:hypothetical protein